MELNQEQENLEQQPEQGNDEAMASMMAGYNKQRGIEPEADPAPEPEAAEVATPEVAAEPEAPAPQLPSINDLMAHIGRVEETSAKAHGKIGELNRTIQQLQQRPQPANGEVSPDVVAALQKAEAIAEEFPDLAGPLVEVMKALSKGVPAAAPAAPMPDVDKLVEDRVAAIRLQEAKELLADEHPDYESIKTTPEYKAWLQSKDDAFRTKFLKSVNATYVAKQLTEFKTWRDAQAAAERKKNERLENALTPQGEGNSGPSKLPDSAGLAAGYNKVRRLRTAA